jgi:hypothetical protein
LTEGAGHDGNAGSLHAGDGHIDHVGAAETILQFGGKASTGRGRCRLLPVE